MPPLDPHLEHKVQSSSSLYKTQASVKNTPLLISSDSGLIVDLVSFFATASSQWTSRVVRRAPSSLPRKARKELPSFVKLIRASVRSQGSLLLLLHWLPPGAQEAPTPAFYQLSLLHTLAWIALLPLPHSPSLFKRYKSHLAAAQGWRTARGRLGSSFNLIFGFFLDD